MEAERPSATEQPGRRVEITIAPGDGGVRLDRALQHQLPELSRTRLKQLMLTGAVSSGGKLLCDPAQRADPGARVIVMVPAPDEPTPAAQPIALDIRFEDEHLIVLDKPAGMVVHPAPGNPEGTLVNALLAHCGPSLAGIGGVRRPGIVHRLDKDTSGLLVAAKTETAHRALSRDFALRRIARAYSAIVWGVPAPEAGEIAGNIGRSTLNRKKMAVVTDTRGRPAFTRYRVERRFGADDVGADAIGIAALVQCRLLTGRTHQIRVHLAHIGHPLIGDQVYGTRAGRAFSRFGPHAGEAGPAIAGFPRQALHARLLGFTHPVSGAPLSFESPLPADMAGLLANLELL
jgi:23S rRNA pseudouridine1911/1915/1917 synthase